FEDQVSEASASGRWTKALSAHVDGCDDCREIRLVASVLGQQRLAPARPLLDPSALWNCGRHARRISTESRMSVVVAASEIGILVGLLAVLFTSVDWRSVASVVTHIQLPPLAWQLGAVLFVALGAFVVVGVRAGSERGQTGVRPP